MDNEIKYSDTSLQELLGRSLNDVESKFAPEKIFYKGSMNYPLSCPKVSVIGSRDASEQGLAKASEISKYLVENNITIISGLAKGIDTIAHKTAMKCGGRTIAVIGTPLNKVYPRENATLQDEIMQNHLVISQYPIDHNTMPKDFALRNKTMALISDAAIIVEAKDSSGSLYHGWESLRLGRPLFISKPAIHEKLEWPEKMIKYGAMILDELPDILENLKFH